MHLCSHELSNTPSPKGLAHNLKAQLVSKSSHQKKAKENKEKNFKKKFM